MLTFADVAQQVAHRLGKIKNGTFYHLKNNKKHTQISICLCGAAGSAQPW